MGLGWGGEEVQTTIVPLDRLAVRPYSPRKMLEGYHSKFPHKEEKNVTRNSTYLRTNDKTASSSANTYTAPQRVPQSTPQ